MEDATYVNYYGVDNLTQNFFNSANTLFTDLFLQSGV